MNEWQPINTAPGNEYVLVFCPDATDEDQIMLCAFLVFEAPPGEPDDEGDWYQHNLSHGEGAPLDVEPTHWMRLPKRPA